MSEIGRSRVRNLKVYAPFVVSMVATPASACPLCHTETARQIRAAIFGPDFWFNVGVTILPFVLFLGITALIYGKPRSEPRRISDPDSTR